MRAHTERELTGPAGKALEVLVDETDNPDTAAAIATWFLDCPGQSPAWRHYMLGVLHLRDVAGQSKPAIVRVAGATHELNVVALDPSRQPTAADPTSWGFLMPINVTEQFAVSSDADAVELAHLAAKAVVVGVLPAEPALAGQVEPWRTAIIKTAAHMRGEAHAS